MKLHGTGGPGSGVVLSRARAAAARPQLSIDMGETPH